MEQITKTKVILELVRGVRPKVALHSRVAVDDPPLYKFIRHRTSNHQVLSPEHNHPAARVKCIDTSGPCDCRILKTFTMTSITTISIVCSFHSPATQSLHRTEWRKITILIAIAKATGMTQNHQPQHQAKLTTICNTFDVMHRSRQLRARRMM